MRSVTVRDNQSLFDIAVQEFGGVDAAFDLARLNEMGFTDDLKSGQILNTTLAIIDAEIVAYFSSRNLKPAMGTSGVKAKPEGVDYWYIQGDFVVS